ncbi:hypothetical protein [Terriglobus roseus]|uniref:hypothetical protein n=1 Tax=Terriglobus roseus TaxID=392734 RepID=UPI001E4CA7B5|nr:hypothetical protein [Terriglobus roseus]
MIVLSRSAIVFEGNLDRSTVHQTSAAGADETSCESIEIALPQEIDMKIKSEFEIRFHIQKQTPIVAVLHVHPCVESKLLSADTLKVEQIVAANEPLEPTLLHVSQYIDSFGNRCSRFVAPAEVICLYGSNVVEVSDTSDRQEEGLLQTPIEDLPDEALQFLLASRYCQVDEFGAIATELFGSTKTRLGTRRHNSRLGT